MARNSSFSATTSQAQCRFGAQVGPDGVTFKLWAPSAPEAKLCLFGAGTEEIRDMRSEAGGWFSLTVPEVGHGQRYQYLVNDLRVPDPASRQQDQDVHGPSVVIDPTHFQWADQAWRGLPWEETVLYELHVGTFTPEGTFRGVMEKLDYLKQLGVTAIELMPLSDFPGQRNWGYDGVLHFAPDTVYGTAEDLKRLVDAAHAKGMMMFLDVVYNHFGPEGNYLYVHSKSFFTEKYKTPWGAAIDFEGEHSETVRSFFIENAIYWLNEFHFDGLRFDAVHAIFDASRKPFLEELAETIKERTDAGRHVHLVLENDDNNAHLLQRKPAEPTAPKFFTAQWNDDYHHCLHVVATGETSGYYADYDSADSKHSAIEHLGRVLAEGFAYQGDASAYRSGEKRGQPSAHLPPTAFVAFTQNHDQIGNRAFGERLAALAPVDALRWSAAVTLLAPQIPMLFMAEEWGSKTPFNFFCDFGPDLSPLVKEGRRAEFAKFPEFQDETKRELIPDPTAEQTWRQSVLNWSEPEQRFHEEHLNFVKSLIQVRKREIVPLLPFITAGGMWRKLGESALDVRWRSGNKQLVLITNASNKPVETKLLIARDSQTIFSTHVEIANESQLPAWSVIWSVENANHSNNK